MNGAACASCYPVSPAPSLNFSPCSSSTRPQLGHWYDQQSAAEERHDLGRRARVDGGHSPLAGLRLIQSGVVYPFPVVQALQTVLRYCSSFARRFQTLHASFLPVATLLLFLGCSSASASSTAGVPTKLSSASRSSGSISSSSGSSTVAAAAASKSASSSSSSLSSSPPCPLENLSASRAAASELSASAPLESGSSAPGRPPHHPRPRCPRPTRPVAARS